MARLYLCCGLRGSVSLHHGAVSWSAVCDCRVSFSNSVIFKPNGAGKINTQRQRNFICTCTFYIYIFKTDFFLHKTGFKEMLFNNDSAKTVSSKLKCRRVITLKRKATMIMCNALS